jgi:hypothetical protein
MVPRRNREPPVAADTWLCCSARAGIEIPIHDPLWNYTNEMSSREFDFGYLLYHI